MKDKRTLLKIVFLVVLLLIVILARVAHMKKNNLNIENITYCTLVTDDVFKPMASGDYVNVRFEINLNNKTVVKYEDYYTATGKALYKNMVVFHETIGSKYKNQLTDSLEKIIDNYKINGNTKADSYYTLIVKRQKIRFTDEEIVAAILKVID